MAPWHILGTGAIGTLFAFQLQRAGCAPVLLHRAGHPVPGTRHLHDAEGEHSSTFAQESIDAPGTIQRLLLCTKAFDAADALTGVGSRLQADSVVVVLANGMGFEPALRAQLPELAVFRAICTEGACRDPQRLMRVSHAGLGHTWVGQCSMAHGVAVPTPPLWFSESLGRLPRCHWEADIGAALWRKFALNCAINALSAIYGCRNGALLTQASIAAELRALCAEIEFACAALGWAHAVQPLWPQVEQVLQATASNRSSMLQDVRSGRRTEIDYLNGHLLQLGDACGLSLPHNRTLMARLRALSPLR